MNHIFVGACALVFLAVVQRGSSLQCWHCSSDIDHMCNDPFNTTLILQRRGGGLYDSQQQYYQQNERFEQQNQRYDQNYNQNYNRPGFNGQPPRGPQLIGCNEDEARVRRMKNVCIKKVQKSSANYMTVIRRCGMVPFDREVGTCNDPVNRGITLEFCEYCDYDGCNAATGLKTNLILASMAPLVLMLFFRK